MNRAAKKILVVDDEPGILMVVSIQLRLHGYDCVTTANGSDSIELVRIERPDAVLLDIVLPYISGLEVLKKIRAFSKVPIIAFSANSKMAEIAVKNGANIFVAKPFVPSFLIETIRNAVSG